MDKKVKWIFFDVGTTLVDETEAYNHRIRDAIEGTDISFQQFNEKRIYFAKQNLKGDLEAIKYFGLSQTPWHKEDEVLYSSSEEILKYFCEKGYKIGIIANQSFGTAERLENWGILKYIDVIASSAELGVAKPDRAIFSKALEMAGCVAQEAVMIGDRLDNDISPAQKLGMQTIWVRQGFAIYQNLQLAECQPDYIVDNLLELKEIPILL
ncbi:MAG: HAD family hydrolase [Acetatifactor sp.]|nr:HAD family hydrolase [Acetatifactor sp.]